MACRHAARGVFCGWLICVYAGSPEKHGSGYAAVPPPVSRARLPSAGPGGRVRVGRASVPPPLAGVRAVDCRRSAVAASRSSPTPSEARGRLAVLGVASGCDASVRLLTTEDVSSSPAWPIPPAPSNEGKRSWRHDLARPQAAPLCAGPRKVQRATSRVGGVPTPTRYLPFALGRRPFCGSLRLCGVTRRYGYEVSVAVECQAARCRAGFEMFLVVAVVTKSFYQIGIERDPRVGDVLLGEVHAMMRHHGRGSAALAEPVSPLHDDAPARLPAF